MLPLVRLLDGQGTVVIRSGEATDGVGRDAGDLTRKSPQVAGTSRRQHGCDRPVAERQRFNVSGCVTTSRRPRLSITDAVTVRLNRFARWRRPRYFLVNRTRTANCALPRLLREPRATVSVRRALMPTRRADLAESRSARPAPAPWLQLTSTSS